PQVGMCGSAGVRGVARVGGWSWPLACLCPGDAMTRTTRHDSSDPVPRPTPSPGPRWAAAAALAGVLLLAGCTGGEPEPEGSELPLPASVAASASPSASVSPEPSEEAEAEGPERPAAMDKKDADGAAAAAEYFLSLYDYMLTTGDSSRFE